MGKMLLTIFSSIIPVQDSGFCQLWNSGKARSKESLPSSDASLHILQLSTPNPTNMPFETTPFCGPSPIFSCCCLLGLLFTCLLYILQYLDSGVFGSGTWGYQAPPCSLQNWEELYCSRVWQDPSLLMHSHLTPSPSQVVLGFTRLILAHAVTQVATETWH